MRRAPASGHEAIPEVNSGPPNDAAQQAPTAHTADQWEIDQLADQHSIGSDEEEDEYEHEARWAAVEDELENELPFIGESSSDEEDDAYDFILSRLVATLSDMSLSASNTQDACGNKWFQPAKHLQY